MSTTRSTIDISIIIPTYNSSQTLDRTLSSIVNQTYREFEVIIMDALSNDRTVDIAKKYRGIIKNLIIISEKDTGIYEAMNKGINLAKGEWLYFMGSDDSFYELTTFEKFITNKNLKNNDVIYGNVISSRFHGIYDGEFTFEKIAKKNICHQAIFFNKRTFDKIGKFNLKYKAHADWDHNIRWFFSSNINAKYINLIIANYADGGFSSINGDEIFKKDKPKLLLRKGITKLPLSQLISIINNIITQKQKDKKQLSKFIYKVLSIKLRVIQKIKNWIIH